MTLAALTCPNRLTRLSLLAVCASLAVPALAADVYAGGGFPGYTLGASANPDPHLTLRAEVAGGLSLSRNGRREGLDYEGRAESGRAALFIDWHPFAGAFRFVGGVTANDIRMNLAGRGTTATINGKPVSLAGETLNVRIKYRPTTPYVGLGWGHQGGTGLGYYADIGAHFGQFETRAETTLVGKYGVTQADVDTEVAKLREDVARYKVLPAATIGVTYRF